MGVNEVNLKLNLTPFLSSTDYKFKQERTFQGLASRELTFRKHSKENCLLWLLVFIFNWLNFSNKQCFLFFLLCIIFEYFIRSYEVVTGKAQGKDSKIIKNAKNGKDGSSWKSHVMLIIRFNKALMPSALSVDCRTAGAFEQPQNAPIPISSILRFFLYVVLPEIDN